jgi:hypothetical protein
MMTETSHNIMQQLAAKTQVGYSFDQEFYTSDAVFKADFDQVISQKWLLAGHVSRIPNKGDYFLFRVGNEQIMSAPSSTFAATADRRSASRKAAMRRAWSVPITLGPSVWTGGLFLRGLCQKISTKPKTACSRAISACSTA